MTRYSVVERKPDGSTRVVCSDVSLDEAIERAGAVDWSATIIADVEAEPGPLPGVFDLRRQLGRAPTVAEFRATRGYPA